ncbi:amino acid ABC transporter substrate-binding protein [Paucibacter sp. PLA-PC-4]|uniref:amino acid ABC transporter substrate-binding protein n=1 Tax=Paucibacter sp. PLA-PC-4 TaxID=2993655 RepID=UPI002248E9E9|nr:amino acid ABC transporter substrate-binding protein [Paucibacter sp. PLA-PC-4]MCX2862486.1 amino acid ABC transporter substrate-binding protein [Paucibacter sp. PLA-PC-4]
MKSHAFRHGQPAHALLLTLLLLQPALPCGSAHAGPTLDRIKSSGRIVLAHRESSVPFSYLDAQRRPVGYALDLCHRLGEALRKHLQLKSLATDYVQVSSSDRIAVIAEGRADLECGSTTNNAERREKVAFTVPHYITGSRYLVRADSGIKELSDFAKRRLVSTKGTTSFKEIQAVNRDRLLGIQILEAPDHGRAFEMVEKGEADGFVMDDVLLYGLIAGSKNPKGLEVVGKFLTIEPLAVMMSREDAELKRFVDAEMKRLIASREAHALYERWFQQPIPPKQTALNLPISYLLRDFWKYPSDQVPN